MDHHLDFIVDSYYLTGQECIVVSQIGFGVYELVKTFEWYVPSYVCRLWKWSNNRYMLCISYTVAAAAALIVAYVPIQQQQQIMNSQTIHHTHTLSILCGIRCASRLDIIVHIHSCILMHPIHAYADSTIISFNNGENIVLYLFLSACVCGCTWV